MKSILTGPGIGLILLAMAFMSLLRGQSSPSGGRNLAAGFCHLVERQRRDQQGCLWRSPRWSDYLHSGRANVRHHYG